MCNKNIYVFSVLISIVISVVDIVGSFLVFLGVIIRQLWVQACIQLDANTHNVFYLKKMLNVCASCNHVNTYPESWSMF